MKRPLRLAAVGDLHCKKTSQGTLEPLFAKMSAAGVRIVARLSEAATVRVALERASTRRRVLVLRATYQLGSGLSVLRIRRVRGRTLPKGRYRARVRAMDAAGQLSAKRTLTFSLR